MVMQGYKRYRVSAQRFSQKPMNVEFVLVIDTRRKSDVSRRRTPHGSLTSMRPRCSMRIQKRHELQRPLSALNAALARYSQS